MSVVRKGAAEIEGLTDANRPRPLGPKRAQKIRKLFNLIKADDVRQFVVRREVPSKKADAGGKSKFKSPKIQRLITPTRMQRGRAIQNLKKSRYSKAQAEAAAYAELVSARNHARREAHHAAHHKGAHA